MRVAKALVQAEVKVQAQDGNADDRAAGKRPVIVIELTLNNGKKNARFKAMQIAVGLQGGV
ncbi:hypothetical protein CFP56_011463 [Quercus suber]|uniref:Uncharacterized protein n=1 Tax=Quercus suber TaxID=58331 RepID=A0AAW0M4V6_QUESU